MKKVILNTPDHKVIFFEELTPASAVQAYQVLIIHKEVILPQRSTKVSGKEYLRARVINLKIPL